MIPSATSLSYEKRDGSSDGLVPSEFLLGPAVTKAFLTSCPYGKGRGAVRHR